MGVVAAGYQMAFEAIGGGFDSVGCTLEERGSFGGVAAVHVGGGREAVGAGIA